LPVKVQEGLRKEKITMGHARALVNLPNERAQMRLYERIVDAGLSVRKVEDVVRAALQGGRKAAKPAKAGMVSSADVHDVEERLRRALGTRVKVRTKGPGKGEIVVEYYSLDDLDRLLELFESGR
jgi:ParB family chromosome partitioning protein